MDRGVEIKLLTLQLNLETIKLGIPSEKTNIIIRETVNEIYNYIISGTGAKTKLSFMSEAFYLQWSANKGTCKTLNQFGRYEHKIPMKVMIKEMIKLETTSCLYDYLSNTMKFVWVTFDEDDRLKIAGYNDSLPIDGTDRYDAVGIKIMDELIPYK